jgi:hypothetical protein
VHEPVPVNVNTPEVALTVQVDVVNPATTLYEIVPLPLAIAPDGAVYGD